MIKENSFSKEWIISRCVLLKRGKNKADPELVEKVIYALYLLESIKKAGLPFIFKGGTALLLLLKEIHRFSIDIDILIEKDISTYSIIEMLNNLIRNNNIFYKFEKSKRANTKNINKTHFKFCFRSLLDGRDKYILLDVLFESNSFAELVEKEISCNLLDIEDEIQKVLMPSIECILGDKLTAFAPNTTGIPYGVNKELEIIKQMFDISILFDEVKNLRAISDTFSNIAKNEIRYRNLAVDLSEIYNDIIDTSITIAFRGKSKIEEFSSLLEGIKRVRSFIISKNFILEEAVLSAAKVAYLTALLKNKIYEIDFFNNKKDITNLEIIDERFRNNFKSIKKFSPEAYYYLYKFVEINNKI
ncbi:MAG: nucleotidyl transferase AbiEii/AbiGii toxin family protein [Actinobacteria bacterium]|nr:nucleotidyl transferase AbiEii/AbiGii toxin family protein [Actinomycetota bacterium]